MGTAASGRSAGALAAADDAGLQSNAPWLALAIALLWTLHPLQTEAVTYVIQRVESLMGLFFLLTLYCFIRGIRANGAEAGDPQMGGEGMRRDREIPPSNFESRDCGAGSPDPAVARST